MSQAKRLRQAAQEAQERLLAGPQRFSWSVDRLLLDQLLDLLQPNNAQRVLDGLRAQGQPAPVQALPQGSCARCSCWECKLSRSGARERAKAERP